MRAERKSRIFQQGTAMKNRITGLLMGALAIVLGGCANDAQVTVLKPVGPAPVVQKSHSLGFLVAYTPVRLPPIQSDTLFYPHTSYGLYDGRGVFLRQVRNHLGAWDETPETVALPTGRYSIHVQTGAGDDLIVPVIIRGGRTTVVELAKNSRYAVTAVNPG
jgi:hypothetical protein